MSGSLFETTCQSTCGVNPVHAMCTPFYLKFFTHCELLHGVTQQTACQETPPLLLYSVLLDMLFMTECAFPSDGVPTARISTFWRAPLRTELHFSLGRGTGALVTNGQIEDRLFLRHSKYSSAHSSVTISSKSAARSIVLYENNLILSFWLSFVLVLLSLLALLPMTLGYACCCVVTIFV